ncbi:MAG: pyridoxal phosphate-dependent aminotransferase [Cyanobacteria bacterium K_Offshore_surface_m2_011]|nr:pyridoxal phosphate-dependent aminotransferase [Cyanobacteria bacterium K_Offshore_surface_m2_011]
MSDRFADSFRDGAVPLDLLRQRAHNLRWAEQPPGVIPLTAADPDFPAAPIIRDAIADYARSGVFSYGPAGGLGSFRQGVAGYLRQRGASVLPEGVVAVNSAAAGLALVTRHWLSPGDEAIVWDPVDFLFAHTVRSAGGVPVLWRIEPEAPLDLAALEALVTPRTRVLCLCNPHNPLGRCFRRDELEALGRFCLERGLRVLSDEVWSDVVYPPATFTSWLALEPELAGLGAVVHGASPSPSAWPVCGWAMWRWRIRRRRPGCWPTASCPPPSMAWPPSARWPPRRPTAPTAWPGWGPFWSICMPAATRPSAGWRRSPACGCSPPRPPSCSSSACRRCPGASRNWWSGCGGSTGWRWCRGVPAGSAPGRRATCG